MSFLQEFHAPAWLEPFQSVPAVEVDTGDKIPNLGPFAAQAQRGAGAREVHWRTRSESQYFCVLLTDLRGKAKRLWPLLCCESDKDKWHHCFCYLEAAGGWGEDKG